jgi:hypothetical protein
LWHRAPVRATRTAIEHGGGAPGSVRWGVGVAAGRPRYADRSCPAGRRENRSRRPHSHE